MAKSGPKTRLKTEYVGSVFGRLTVTGVVVGPRSNQWFMWECSCGRCGSSPLHNVLNGSTKSCGCLNRENMARATLSHGHCRNEVNKRSPAYNCWRSMKDRCMRPKNKFYHCYGGRGITICEKWMDFSSFYADMGDPPSPTHTIDRKDVNGNYEPNNCQWTTKSEQAHNRRPANHGR